MAIVKSGLFRKIKGSVSDVTFRERRNGKIELGQKHKPTDPRSTAQLDSRAGYTQLMKIYAEAAWVDITQYDRLAAITDISAWNAFVKRHQGSMKRDPTAYWGIAETSALVQIHDFQEINDSIAQAYTPKQYGPADVSILGIDNLGDYLKIADNSGLDVTETDDFYFSAWIKGVETSTNGQIADKLDTVVANNRGYQITLRKTGKVRFNLYDTTKPAGGWPLRIETATDIRDNEWHFIEAVRDLSAGMGYIYIDGVLEASDTDETTLTSANSEDLIIANNQGLTQSLQGDMRDITLDIG